MAELQLPKLIARVRFPSLALRNMVSDCEFSRILRLVSPTRLRNEFFDRAGIESTDLKDQRVGSLSRLARYMERHGIAEDVVRDVMKPLRNVRQARQRPAHALRENIHDKKFVHKQVTLLHDINQTLIALRDWFSTHPKNREWGHSLDGLRDYQM
ncbi:MAG: hypothetical protein JWP70_2046 [Leifsonia sp.]|nr:hypothetical protein [Leifsonia sp.]